MEARDILIVRQVALKCASESVAAQTPIDEATSEAIAVRVLTVCKAFEDWLVRGDVSISEIEARLYGTEKPNGVQPPSAPPDASVPRCACGPRVYKSGTNKSGKAWAGWMCPSNPGKCPPEWA